MINHWETISDEILGNLKIFDLHKVQRRNPVSDKEGTFVYLDSPSWVNIIPITRTGNIVLIKQFRHGTNEMTIEIPGGLVELNEDPGSAGERECLEETGYSSDMKAEILGLTTPNPAFINNKCFSYVWKDVECKSAQNLDGNEEIEVFEKSWDEVTDMIYRGIIHHSLVLNAFFYYILKNGLTKK